MFTRSDRPGRLFVFARGKGFSDHPPSPVRDFSTCHILGTAFCARQEAASNGPYRFFDHRNAQALATRQLVPRISRMSQYPHPYGYGQYHGQYPPQPYAYQNVPSNSAPGHEDSYNPFALQIHHDASQAAFGLNGASIPGLGIGGMAATGIPPGFAPSAAAWGQQPGVPTPGPNVAPQGYGANPLESQHPQPGVVPGVSNNRAKPVASSAPSPPHLAADIEMEEGELSEGQFEDLYEPREYVPSAPLQPVSKVTATGDPSQPPSAADTPDGGFYGTDEDDAGKNLAGVEGTRSSSCQLSLLTVAARERSASYSPFLSPREVESEIPTPPPAADRLIQTHSSQPVVDAPGPPLLGLQLPNQPPIVASTDERRAQFGVSPHQSQKASSSSFKSLQEAKKEAQKAILRLWPLVKYQNYIDEGFDEKLVKGLFQDLNLDMPKTTAKLPTAQPKAAQPRQGGASDSTHPNQPSATQPQQTTLAMKDSSATSDQSKKGEERKDRIARLLAAKAAKAPAVTSPATPKPSAPAPKQPVQSVLEAQPPQETTPAPPAPPASASSKIKPWGEKERLLQQKIAALQKSRAQKSATDTAGSGALPVGNNGTPASQAITDSPSSISIPTGPRAASLPHAPAPVQPTASETRFPLLALTSPPNAQPNLSSQRKRPVASDFVEYSTASAPSKRPFGQSRKETSLIIDVSDVSDDEDTEMDMDMGSPVDETFPIQSASVRGQRGPAIRDFPPLSDTFPPRQFSSPTPSVTPPVGPANNKRREIELGLKEKAIQDMRRKIALAEARRKIKQSSGGSVTPNQAAPASEIGDSDIPQLPRNEAAESLSSPDHFERDSPQPTPAASSARLPRPSEMSPLDPLERAERRTRLMSLEIPQVKSSLQTKLNRLQELQDEQARLKAEIDRSVAEQKRLADELEQLDTTPPGESPQPNGQGSEEAVAALFLTHAAEETDDQQEAEESTPSLSERSRESDHLSADEAASSDGRPQGESPPAVDNLEDNNAESASEDAGMPLGDSTDSFDLCAGTEPSLPSSDANAQEESTNASLLSPTLQPAQTSTAASPMLEQSGAANADETTPMELDSQPPSTTDGAEPVSSIDAGDETSSTRLPSVPLPDQISSVAQPREAEQEQEIEIETETTGEVKIVSSSNPSTSWLTGPQVHDQPAPKSGSTLAPYESPLRYFHAYRFHPEYQNAVSGGLKSLTYSNRIDPEKELCPYELSGKQCPADCEFQHFGSIRPPGESFPDSKRAANIGPPSPPSGR